MHMSAQLALPPIALDSLPERTKDFILGICNGSDLTPEEAVRRVLNQAALPVSPEVAMLPARCRASSFSLEAPAASAVMAR
jgi:hypothetical protein